MINKKAVLVSNKYPFPCDDGKKTVLSGFTRYLLDRYGEENVTYIVIGSRQESDDTKLPCRVVWIDPPGRVTQVANVMVSLLGLSKKSIQEAMTYAKSIERQLHSVINEIMPDMVLLDTVRVGQYFWSGRPGKERYVLYMDDLFYIRYQRMLDAAATDTHIRFDPAGTFAPFLPNFVKSSLRSAKLQNVLFKVEKRKIERREIESVSVFDQCLLINPNEAEILNQRNLSKKVHSIKPLLYAEPCKVERNYDGSPTFLMFGSLRHPVYRASVNYFLKNCMQSAISKMPGIRIRIVGGHADESTRELVSLYGGHVEISGFIPSLDEVFSTSCALIIPIVAAGGLKIKTITALYYGLPIISTDNGVNGIPLENEKHFIRENEVNRFPDQMLRVCDMGLNKQLSRNAKRIFDEQYSLEQVYKDYDKYL